MRLIYETDPRLRNISSGVENPADLKDILRDMEHIMRTYEGIGLAAPQVGIPIRALIIDMAFISAKQGEEGLISEKTLASTHENPAENPILHIINPRIISCDSNMSDYEEGCLSLPTIYANITRPETIEIEYVNTSGIRKNLKAAGILARVLQHEIDHLNGKLFTDHISPIKRKFLLNRLHKLLKSQ